MCLACDNPACFVSLRRAFFQLPIGVVGSNFVIRLPTISAYHQSGGKYFLKLFQRYQKTWSSISAAEKLREVLEQAKQKEKPVDKVSKNETDAVAIVA
jgi:hypothetical protein